MTIQNNQKGINISEIDTPSIIVDLDIVENNIKKMQNFANDNDVSMRPHSKTNKSPYWAKKQIDQGCLLYTSPSPRDVEECRMPSSA